MSSALPADFHSKYEEAVYALIKKYSTDRKPSSAQPHSQIKEGLAFMVIDDKRFQRSAHDALWFAGQRPSRWVVAPWMREDPLTILRITDAARNEAQKFFKKALQAKEDAELAAKEPQPPAPIRCLNEKRTGKAVIIKPFIVPVPFCFGYIERLKLLFLKAPR